MSITQLTAGTKLTRQAITKHLQMMEEAGLIRAARHGRESIWNLELGRIGEARRALDANSLQWAALNRLKRFVEE